MDIIVSRYKTCDLEELTKYYLQRTINKIRTLSTYISWNEPINKQIILKNRYPNIHAKDGFGYFSVCMKYICFILYYYILIIIKNQ